MGFRDKHCDQQIQQTILQLSQDIGDVAECLDYPRGRDDYNQALGENGYT